jgi:hypothetical protein
MGVYIRTKDKIEKYADSLMKKYGNCELSSGLRSRYYTINGKVLRISDHIGSHNDAYVSIIIPSFDTGGNYILHAHNGGQVSIVDYEKVKEVVRSFFYLSSFFCEVGADRRNEVNGDGERIEETYNFNKMVKKLEELEVYKKKANKKTKTILGLPMDSFSEKQLKQIALYIKQNAEK